MEAMILFACVVVAAATLIFVLYVRPDASDLAPHRSRLDQLIERRDTIYENLRDLKFEYRSGKYGESDFEEMKRSLESEAAKVLADIEEVTGGVVRPVRREPAASAAAPATGKSNS